MANGSGLGARGTGHGTRGTGLGARSLGHGAWGTGLGARGTGHAWGIGALGHAPARGSMGRHALGMDALCMGRGACTHCHRASQPQCAPAPTACKSTALRRLRLTALPIDSPTSLLALLLLHEVPTRAGADGVAGHRAELHDAQATPREAHQPPGRSNESIAPPPSAVCEAKEMLHAFKRRKCYTPLKNGCY